MRRHLHFLLYILIVFIFQDCDRGRDELKDTEKLFKKYQHQKDVVYMKLPPKLTRAFLRKEEASVQLTDFLKDIHHIQILKLKNIAANRKTKEQLLDDLDLFFNYHHFNTIEANKHAENPVFVMYNALKPDYHELITAFNEDSSFTVVCLRGKMNNDQINSLTEELTISEILHILNIFDQQF